MGGAPAGSTEGVRACDHPRLQVNFLLAARKATVLSCEGTRTLPLRKAGPLAVASQTRARQGALWRTKVLASSLPSAAANDFGVTTIAEIDAAAEATKKANRQCPSVSAIALGRQPQLDSATTRLLEANPGKLHPA
jgi:hypothetical protein